MKVAPATRQIEAVAFTRAARTFPQLIRAAAAMFGSVTAVKTANAGSATRSLTFTELERRSAELSRALIAVGIGKGSRIGFIYGNCPELVVSLAAIARIGAVAIPISTRLKADELFMTLRQSDVSGLFVGRHIQGEDYIGRLCEALPSLRDSSSAALRLTKTPYLRWIVSTGEALPRGVCGLEDFLGSAFSVSDDLLQEMETEIHSTDQMMEIYTYGYSALPRGVKHHHGAVLARTHSWRSILRPLRGMERIMKQPMYRTGGLMKYLLPNLEAGATSVCIDETRKGGRMIPTDEPTTADFQPLSCVNGHWELGMSETLGPYSYARVLKATTGAPCARLQPIAQDYEIRVVDDQGVPVQDGEDGEIQVRGYSLTFGLHKVERSECFTADGFYRTGERGLMEGPRIYIVGHSHCETEIPTANGHPVNAGMSKRAKLFDLRVR